MKTLFKRQCKNEDGSVLLAVLTIMTFATILASTAFSFVRTASQRSYENVNEKQAYYTASTCLETFIESVLTPNNDNWDDFVTIAEAGGTSDPIEIEGMGTCTIKVQKPSGLGYIKVMSTAEINGMEETVVCYLRAITEPTNAIFENAIELTGKLNSAYDNVHVVGDVAGSNDTNPDMVYIFDNESVIHGKYFQYGTVQSINHIDFKESITGKGVSFTATKYICFGNNDVNISSNVKKQDNSTSNFIFAGNAFTTMNTRTTLGKQSSSVDGETGVKSGDLDLFASGIVIDINMNSASATEFSQNVADYFRALNNNSDFRIFGIDQSHFVQYGNIYCFANGGVNTPGRTDADLAGNMVLDDKAQVTVTGNVFVEGNLYVAPQARLTIKGNLYVKGQILGTTSNITVNADPLVSESGRIYCTSYGGKTHDLDPAVFDSFKSGRGATPSAEYEGTKFIYNAEDILISEDENISTISADYKALVTNPDAYGIDRFSAGNYEGINFDLIITDSCYIGQYDLNNINNILVKITNKDVLVVFEKGTRLDNGRKILVKNDTKHLEESDSLNPSFCYFTVDTYTPSAKVTPIYKTDEAGNIVYDKKGRKTIIGSEHEGFIDGATLYMDNCCIGDYDTWRNANVGYQVAGVNCGTQALNLTGAPIDGTYDPVFGYIIMLLTDGTQIKAQNACQIEATVYGREAIIEYNATPPVVRYATGNAASPNYVNHNTFSIGSLVVEKLSIGNNPYLAFCQPSSKSNLANLGGSGADKVMGYEVLKYTKDLS